jgi:GH15 family glucan-1,4-alpha-glucosidase
MSQAGRRPPGSYLPIAEHGLIGDMHSVALVGTDGTIDWYCPGRVDAPSAFGSILDAGRGGCWRLEPDCEVTTAKQLYLPDTNILITRFLTPEGVGEIHDFMPAGQLRAGGTHRQRILRRVLTVRGSMPFTTHVDPRFDYGRAAHEAVGRDHGAVFRAPALSLVLETDLPLELREGAAHTRFHLEAGESTTFVLETLPPGAAVPVAHSAEQIQELFEATIAYWRGWLGQSRYTGRWREMVHRSALTLKLLTYAPSGAIVAAPTTSLPEELGGGRNWDYRYTWIRDAAFSLYALLRLGFTEEASAFMAWLTERLTDERSQGSGPPLQIMYGVDGSRDLEETVLGHWEGYMGSAPVRIGNGAAGQLQLDIYGELIDSVYLYNKHGTPIYHEAWEHLSRIVDWVCEN